MKNERKNNVWGKLIDIEDPIKRIKIVDDKMVNSCDLTSIILEMSGDKYYS